VPPSFQEGGRRELPKFANRKSSMTKIYNR